MKRCELILKLILFYLIGYLVFIAIISLIEGLFLIQLSDGVVDFGSIFIKVFKENGFVYTVVFLLISLFNIAYNLVSIKILNSKLEKMKKE